MFRCHLTEPLQKGFSNSSYRALPVAVLKNGRDDWIRTSDLLTPSEARYHAALRPDDGMESGVRSRAVCNPCYSALASRDFPAIQKR